VLGLPGDSIASDDEGIVVGSSGEEILLKPALDSCHLHLMVSQQIPEGYYFLAGEHPSSFDSRYEEFGLVAEAEIGELLWPVF
jgi:conjugal transfer pilin signal peptidase TrbI